MISAQRDITYPESANSYLAVLGARTGQLYRSYSSPPYVVQPFGPLFYAVNAGIARAASLDLDKTDRICRVLSFCCYLLCGVAAYGITRELAFSKAESALAGLMLLAQPAFLEWDATARPDLASLLGMLLCLWFAIRAERTGQPGVVASGFFAGVAFLLKQSGAGAPAAVAIVWGFRKKYKQVFTLSVSAAIPVLLMLGFLLWRREHFLEQFAAFGKSIWSVPSVIGWLQQTRALMLLCFAGAIGAAGIGRALRGDGREKLVASFVLTNLCLALITIPQVAGNYNYFLPVVSGCALLLPFAMRAVSGSQEWVAVGTLASVVLFVGTYETVWLTRLARTSRRAEVSYAGLAPFRILSEDPYFTVKGKEPELLDPYTSHVFELAGHWDSSEVVGKVREGRYDLVILPYGRKVPTYRGVAFLGQSILDALNGEYEVLCDSQRVLVLKPRMREIAATPETLAPMFGPCELRGTDAAPNLSITAPGR